MRKIVKDNPKDSETYLDRALDSLDFFSRAIGVKLVTGEKGIMLGTDRGFYFSSFEGRVLVMLENSIRALLDKTLNDGHDLFLFDNLEMAVNWLTKENNETHPTKL